MGCQCSLAAAGSMSVEQVERSSEQADNSVVESVDIAVDIAVGLLPDFVDDSILPQ